ncbi:MAG: 4Fe-4S dicluster domain-containing protein [Clostridiales bacterium]|nr:4Fe-4S dicluster domain-containing protein [Clostridiales bacterium]
MDMMSILFPAVVLGGLGVLFGGLLGVASKKFAVEVDEQVSTLRSYLPGANCSGCGYPSCDAFADAVIHKGVDPSGCMVISAENLQLAGAAIGREVAAKATKEACVTCQGTCENSPPRFQYEGIESCKSAALVAGGSKGCKYACLGCGDCVAACGFGAIKLGEGGIPVVDFDKCTGCGACSRACPRDVIKMIPTDAGVVVRCHTKAPDYFGAQFCRYGCVSCGKCEEICPSGAITVEDGVAKIKYEHCVGCGWCMDACPMGVITPFESYKMN